MKDDWNPFRLMMVLGLLLTAYLATAPMERPGMLELWYGVEPSFLFRPMVSKLSPILVLMASLLAFSVLYLFTIWPSYKYTNHFTIVFLAFAICILWGYIGTFLGEGGVSFDQLGVARWRSILFGMIVFFSLSIYLDREELVSRTLKVITIACLALNSYGLIRYFWFDGLMTESLGKVVFWERSKLELSCFVITYTLAMLLIGENVKRTERLIYWAALVMGYCVVFLSARRTSMILALFSTSAVFLFALRYKKFGNVLKFSILVFIAVSITGIVGFPFVKEKFIDRFSTLRALYDDRIEHSSTEGHLEDFRIGWNEVTKSFSNTVFGVGFVWEPEGSGVSNRDHVYFVHNSFLTFWLYFGVVGIMSYFYIHSKTIWECFKHRNSSLQVYMIVFLIWFIDEFLAGLFFPPFYIYFKSAALFFGALALANACIRLGSGPLNRAGH